jgi:uncharacterized protein (DUF2342 family)
MGKVGYSSVANQANTSDGFALGVGAQNVIGGTDFGLDVGDGGVVDVYGATPVTTFYILDETSPGYVLQENDDKIVLESS